MTKQKLSPAALEIKMLSFLFMKAARTDIARQLKAHGSGVNPLGFGVLNMIKHRPRTLSELSQETILAPATLVPVVQTLEKKGLIERGHDPRDRRRSPLHLTKQGEAMLAKISLTSEKDIVVKKLKGLGEKDVGELRRILRKLVASIVGEKKLAEILKSHIQKHE